MSTYKYSKISFIIVVLFTVFCFPPLFAGKNDAPDQFSSSDIDQFLVQIQNIRSLSAKDPIPIHYMNKEELQKWLTKNLDNTLPSQKQTKYKRILTTFGLLPKSINLRQKLEKVLQQQMGGFYNQKTQKLHVIDRSDFDQTSIFGPEQAGMIESLNMDPIDLVAIHELTHAVQDQHFQLHNMNIDEITNQNEDRGRAIKSLIEGDATYVMYEFLFQKRGRSIRMMSHLLSQMLQSQLHNTSSSLKLSDIPLFIEKELMFPYLAGLRFVMYGVLKTDGWEAINKAYKNPPTSSEQILHPKKYFEERDHPTSIHLPEWRQFFPDKWQPQMTNTLGEYGVQLLFLSHTPDQVSQLRKASKGWDGDRYWSFHHPKKKKTSVLWYTTWDSNRDAKEFKKHAWRMLKKRYPPPDPLSSPEEDHVPYLFSGKNTSVLLQKQNTDVIYWINPPEELPKKLLPSLPERIDKRTLQHPGKSSNVLELEPSKER